MKFEDSFDVKLVLVRGLTRFENKPLLLDRWALEIGCFRSGDHAKEVWMRVIGLPLHLWIGVFVDLQLVLSISLSRSRAYFL